MKVAARFLLILVGIVILTPGFFSAQEAAAGLAGTWSGRAIRQGAKSYSVTVILDGTGTGFIEYPTMKCGGTLRFVRKNGNTLSYQEKITHGKEKCSRDGRVDMVSSGNTLAWSWSAGGDKVTATLTETQATASAGCVNCDLSYDRDLQACYRMTSVGDQQKCQDKADEDSRTCEASCRD